MVIAGLMITGLTLYIYKPTYSVTLNGELIGYTQDKTKLQDRINSCIQSGEGDNLAFIQVEDMPEYHLCLLKKGIATNDDDIYNKIVGTGTKYYRFYALLNDGEEKYYFKNFDDAEKVVAELKTKESANIDKISVIEKYDVNMAECAEIDTAVTNLYQKKVVVQTVKKSSGTTANTGAKGMNNSGYVINLGVSLIRPVPSYKQISSRFGWRSRDNHKGIDIAADSGTPIYAAASGTVSEASYGYGGGYGNHVIISHGNGVQTVYGHCLSLCVSDGEYIEQGQLIARVGSTGLSTGNHLHFEVRVDGVAQDPQNYVY